MKEYDVVAIGECLVDVVCTRQKQKLQMEGNPGGAPANVLAIMAKLGHRTALVSKVGADAFGTFLRDQVAQAGVEVDSVVQDEYHPTTLAIVQLDDTGNRSFNFYRDRTADVMLNADELPVHKLQNTKILHFGSLSLTTEPARSATLRAVELARQAGALISYDPNLRPALWANLKEAKDMIALGMQQADLIKVSQEEVEFLTGQADAAQGAKQLYATYHPALLAVTLGPGGCIYVTDGGAQQQPTFDTPCVDTTGAGDASWGAALSWLLQQPAAPAELSAEAVRSLMDFANAAGSLATTKQGAIPAMPGRQEIEQCIRTMPRLLR